VFSFISAHKLYTLILSFIVLVALFIGSNQASSIDDDVKKEAAYVLWAVMAFNWFG